jgi:hypothetical protein
MDEEARQRCRGCVCIGDLRPVENCWALAMADAAVAEKGKKK